jgi:hypothetical protein
MIARKRLPNSSADDAARDSAILLSIAIQSIASGQLVARKFQNRIVFVDDDLRRFLAALPHLSAPNEALQ